MGQGFKSRKAGSTYMKTSRFKHLQFLFLKNKQFSKAGKGNKPHLTLGGRFGGHLKSTAATLPLSHFTKLLMLLNIIKHLVYLEMPPLSLISLFIIGYLEYKHTTSTKKESRKTSANLDNFRCPPSHFHFSF